MSASPERRLRFDPKALQRVRDMAGDDVARAVVTTFLESAPDRIRRAKDAAARGDAAGVRQALHSLVSSAGQLGGVELERLCREGMRSADASDAGLTDVVAGVRQALDGFLTDLRGALREGSA